MINDPARRHVGLRPRVATASASICSNMARSARMTQIARHAELVSASIVPHDPYRSIWGTMDPGTPVTAGETSSG
jgi:hypothetical protein